VLIRVSEIKKLENGVRREEERRREEKRRE